MQRATKKLAKEITTELKGMEKKSPVEQMATYFAIGEMLRAVIENDEATYGQKALLDIVALVPHLKSETCAYRIVNLTCWDEEVREFVLEETATPMNNGQHLTLDHWDWLFRHQPKEASADEKNQWLHRELAWLRKESPSAAVLEHVEEVFRVEYRREVESIRECVRHAIGTLELL